MFLITHGGDAGSVFQCSFIPFVGTLHHSNMGYCFTSDVWDHNVPRPYQ